MKKVIHTILLGFVSAISADPSVRIVDAPITAATTFSELNAPSVPSSIEEVKTGFFYIRFAAAEPEITQMNSILPGLGIGYRRLTGDGAGDISFSGIGYAEKRNGRIFWTAPKTSYIHYFQPDQNQSFYAGGGLAWGGIESEEQINKINVADNEDEYFEKERFIGIIPSVVAGYEFVRKGSVLGFTEIHFSQPGIAVYREGPRPGPIVELTIGIGF